MLSLSASALTAAAPLQPESSTTCSLVPPTEVLWPHRHSPQNWHAAQRAAPRLHVGGDWALGPGRTRATPTNWLAVLKECVARPDARGVLPPSSVNHHVHILSREAWDVCIVPEVVGGAPEARRRQAAAHGALGARATLSSWCALSRPSFDPFLRLPTIAPARSPEVVGDREGHRRRDAPGRLACGNGGGSTR